MESGNGSWTIFTVSGDDDAVSAIGNEMFPGAEGNSEHDLDYEWEPFPENSPDFKPEILPADTLRSFGLTQPKFYSLLDQLKDAAYTSPGTVYSVRLNNGSEGEFPVVVRANPATGNLEFGIARNPEGFAGGGPDGDNDEDDDVQAEALVTGLLMSLRIRPPVRTPKGLWEITLPRIPGLGVIESVPSRAATFLLNVPRVRVRESRDTYRLLFRREEEAQRFVGYVNRGGTVAETAEADKIAFGLLRG